MWCLNSSSGYLVNFDLSHGKNSRGKENYDSVFGKCATPAILFLEKLPPKKRNLPYNLYFDNLFTNRNLLSFLRYRGYSGTGTVRENRIDKTCAAVKKIFGKELVVILKKFLKKMMEFYTVCAVAR